MASERKVVPVLARDSEETYRCVSDCHDIVSAIKMTLNSKLLGHAGTLLRSSMNACIQISETDKLSLLRYPVQQKQSDKSYLPYLVDSSKCML